MSFLLSEFLEEESTRSPISVTHQKVEPHQSQQNFTYSFENPYNLDNENSNFGPKQGIHREIEVFGRKIQAIVVIDINASRKQSNIMCFVEKNALPFTLPSNQISNDIWKIISKINTNYLNCSSEVRLANQRGLLVARSTLRLSHRSCRQEDVHNLVLGKVRELFRFIQLFLHRLLHISNLLPHNQENEDNRWHYYEVLDRQLQKIQGYLSLSLQVKEISKVASREEDRYIEDYESSKEQLYRNYNQGNEESLQDQISVLFQKNSLARQNFMEQPGGSQHLEERQLSNFMGLLQKPSPIMISRQSDNSKFIFNRIKVLNSKSIIPTLRRTDQKFQYFLFQCCFYEILTFNSQKLPKYRPQKIAPRWLMAKHPVDQEIEQQMTHEIDILSQLSSTYSCYFQKYYMSKDQGFDFRDTLLQTPNQSISLQGYLQDCNFCTSLRTKLYFLSQAAQALSFLKESKIALLNMNAKDISVLRSLRIKINTLVCAYSKNVKSKGFIAPSDFIHVAPEVINMEAKQFGPMQDSFSFGILAFRVLFNRDPYLALPEIYKEYQKGEGEAYLKYLFFCLEDSYSSYFRPLVNILVKLIMICLSRDPERRPTPSWIVIIMKSLLDYHIRL